MFLSLYSRIFSLLLITVKSYGFQVFKKLSSTFLPIKISLQSSSTTIYEPDYLFFTQTENSIISIKGKDRYQVN